ncbi:MAG: hypothetical protein HXX08_18725 [Chloroflexi bacterium]|uniref:Glycosyltransferase family 39 protein n=1 Tax=Candidatus Chlorohelix allophototropha TaxID=3003348 RepID=A0A8T7M7B3_9CHLR|nr:hypothetical protein [Chloroflexota bacterium]WJW69797.1 glycosyltransferase family 39 protein [Chloroflexota bacterium L227-S17]
MNLAPSVSGSKLKVQNSKLNRRIFIFFLLLFFLTFGGHLYSGDGFTSYATARSFIEGNGGALDNYSNDTRFALRGADGKLYGKYGLGQALVEIPPILFIKLLSLFSTGFAEDATARFLVSTLNLFVCATTQLLLFKLGRKLGFGTLSAFSVTLLYGIASMSWVYSHLDFSEPLVTLCYLLMFGALLEGQDKRHLFCAGFWLGAAILFKTVAAIALFPLLLYLIMKSGRHNALKAMLWLALPLLATAALLLWYNFYRYGKFTESGYSAIADQFAFGSVYGGIYGFLFSSGKSIFLYAPGLVLALFGLKPFWQRQKTEAVFGLSLFTTYLIFYALFWNWEGDWTWGSRYLYPALPFLFLFALPLLQNRSKPMRWFFKLVLVTGILVNIAGSLVEFNYYFYVSGAANAEPDWRFVPELSPLRGQVFLAASAFSRTAGGASLQMDYTGWDAERVHAVTKKIELAPYDKFDLWWLRFANPEGATNGWMGLIVGGLIGIILVIIIWNSWQRLKIQRDIVAAIEAE